MNTLERLTTFCQNRLAELGWESDKRYVKRLNWELAEISAKNKADYFWQMYETKIRYPINQNNLLVCKLLGICHDYDISQEPACEYGEYPDIDSDFTGIIRDYLKNEWAPKQFGEEYVCNISTYGTYKIKAALLDMARVHDKSHDEIQIITKGIEDKDDDGKPITWDAAMKLYPELKKYCEDNPEVAEAARRIMNRNKSLGIHAGGLIVANKPLSDLVPLVKRKSDPQAAAWPEGLSGQDLGPIGLVKFDLLVIDGLLQISHACRLAKQRHGLAGICAKPGQADWTDLEAWRNDPATLATADRGDLTGIFQFDSPGIQKLVKDGGVTRFEDLVAYSALFRPGPLSMKMDKVYIARKRGKEQFEIHPLLKPILEKTYGVLCVHQNAFISMADGREVAIKNVQEGDLVHSYNEEKGIFESKIVLKAGLTKKDTGLKITLENGVSTIVTPDHKIFTERGWIEAQELQLNTDLIAIPNFLPHDAKNEDIAPWLGSNEDVAYLLGMLIGDGCLTSTGTVICSGVSENHKVLKDKLEKTFPALIVEEYYHGRSWYITLIGKDLENNPIYGNRKKKFNVLLENLDLRHASRTKHVPHIIMQSSKNVKAAFLAGLFDADGAIFKGNENFVSCNITSTSEFILNSVRKILLGEKIYSHLSENRIYIWNSLAFANLINPFVVIKKITGKLQTGVNEGWVSRKLLFDAFKQSKLSQRKFQEKYGINRQHFRRKNMFIRKKILGKILPNKEISFLKIKSIVKIENQQFYDLSVEDNHNFVADGIVVHNCYQEQIMRILHIVGEIPLKDCEAVRKAISKKKIEYFAKYKEMFVRNGMKNLGVSQKESEDLWNLIEAFSEYGFNLCILGSTLVYDRITNEYVTVETLCNENRKVVLDSYVDGEIIPDEVVDVFETGEQEVYEIELENGMTICCTMNHKFICQDGEYHTMAEIIEKGYEIMYDEI